MSNLFDVSPLPWRVGNRDSHGRTFILDAEGDFVTNLAQNGADAEEFVKAINSVAPNSKTDSQVDGLVSHALPWRATWAGNAPVVLDAFNHEICVVTADYGPEGLAERIVSLANSETISGFNDSQVGGDHYKKMAVQPSYYIKGNGLNWDEGNIIKYVSRHRSKGGKEDLEKAMHYLESLMEEYA